MSQPSYGDPDGYGVYGVLQQSDDGLLLCADCGLCFEHLGLHAAHVHDGAADYRVRHGLKRTRGLVADSVRAKQVQNGTRISGSPAGQALAQARDPRRAARIWREMGAPVSAEAAQERDQRMSAVGKLGRKGTVTVCAECGVEFCALIAASKRRYCGHSCANRANRRAPRRPRPEPS
ncbi:MAG: hypothetical protein L0H78_19090 [Humibacillus sp.]|nr:hypothetical protein [Humibacillus sp.]